VSMSRRSHKIAALSLAAVIVLQPALSAQAHVSIRPGVDATGSTVSAFTAGQAGVLNFRIGHGCTVANAALMDPNTGASLVGSKWGTHSFSVDIPVGAQGTGSTVPKAQYVPGWKSSLSKNSTTGVYTITWTAINADFDVPDSPDSSDPTVASNVYADFGVQIKWAADQSGKTIFFKSVQACNVVIPGKATVKTVKTRVNGKMVNSKQTVTAPATIHPIFNSWDVTDGTGADAVADDIEHNTAPSVTVK
jgi:uncharacterized protein YcnI